MIDIVPVHVSTDERGVSFAIPETLTRGYAKSHVVLNRKGSVRGNHAHPNTDEILFVQGPAIVRWRKADRTVEEHFVGEGEVKRFEFPAGVSHAVRNEGVDTTVLVSLQKTNDNAEVQTVRDLILQSVS